MLNFLLCTVLPPGASKVDQTHKFDDFLGLTQLFQIWSHSILMEFNDVNNVIYYNFECNYQLLKVHCFLSRSL